MIRVATGMLLHPLSKPRASGDDPGNLMTFLSDAL